MLNKSFKNNNQKEIIQLISFYIKSISRGWVNSIMTLMSSKYLIALEYKLGIASAISYKCYL